MNTILHGNILSVFFSNQPERIPIGSEYDNARWNSFWEFIKSKTNLSLYQIDELSNIEKLMLTQLSSGRGNTTLSTSDKPFSSHNNKVKCSNPLSIFCIEENNEANRKNYRTKNGYIFAFKDDLLTEWEKVSLLPLKLRLSVRKGVAKNQNTFISWTQLSNYLTPITDVVIVDNYILSDQSLIPSNIEKIMEELNKATPVKFRLTIFTFEGDKHKLDGQETYRILSEIKVRLNLKCEIELIISNRLNKEHDRCIFTNYLTIRSGDSFNYFSSDGTIITHGTDITFGSMANIDERNTSMLTLAEISKKVDRIKDGKAGQFFGSCENQLLIKARLTNEA